MKNFSEKAFNDQSKQEKLWLTKNWSFTGKIPWCKNNPTKNENIKIAKSGSWLKTSEFTRAKGRFNFCQDSKKNFIYKF